jgi:hypothetical protein
MKVGLRLYEMHKQVCHRGFEQFRGCAVCVCVCVCVCHTPHAFFYAQGAGMSAMAAEAMKFMT